MEALAAEYRPKGFEFLFVYTREAHPGERFPHHQSLEQKRRHAQAFRDRWDLQRTILVDDLDGTADHRYGLLPDMCYLLGAGNRVLYKADWTEPDTIRLILDYQLLRIEKRRTSSFRIGPFHAEFLGHRPADWRWFEDRLALNGPQAVTDWQRAMAYWRDRPPAHG